MYLKLFGLSLLLRANVMKAAVKVPTKRLNDGHNIPMIALGTYASDKSKLRENIVAAIEMGYRHIDTATLYENEAQIGEGIRDAIQKSLVRREDLFVTTKLADNSHKREAVLPALKESLRKLGLEYVDLYLIHSPQSTPRKVDHLETWQGMEEAKTLGLAKSIGVSNFNVRQIDRIVAKSKIKPTVNQIEVHPAHTREVLVKHCKDLDIAVMAYSPFGFLVDRHHRNPPTPQTDDPVLTEIAKKYNKTTKQIVLRYLVDRGLIPVPKSSNPQHLRENIDIFYFQLTAQDVTTIGKFNRNAALYGWTDDS